MGYLVTNGHQYVKRTCTRYGLFYGSLVLTTERAEARVWTRESDAKLMLQTITTHAAWHASEPSRQTQRAYDFTGVRVESAT